MDRYMSVGDVAKVLGVVPATVKLMVRSGRLQPAARTVGGLHLFAPADVARLAQQRAGQSARGTETGRVRVIEEGGQA
ncbi:MAG: helix-turn-helix domain-containing protein [Chloroflexota bacterium]|nr:helix-turn-helix domain-containing protein [Chloroflexota bacterium]